MDEQILRQMFIYIYVYEKIIYCDILHILLYFNRFRFAT